MAFTYLKVKPPSAFVHYRTGGLGLGLVILDFGLGLALKNLVFVYITAYSSYGESVSSRRVVPGRVFHPSSCTRLVTRLVWWRFSVAG